MKMKIKRHWKLCRRLTKIPYTRWRECEMYRWIEVKHLLWPFCFVFTPPSSHCCCNHLLSIALPIHRLLRPSVVYWIGHCTKKYIYLQFIHNQLSPKAITWLKHCVVSFSSTPNLVKIWTFHIMWCTTTRLIVRALLRDEEQLRNEKKCIALFLDV